MVLVSYAYGSPLHPLVRSLPLFNVYASCIFLERFTFQCPGAAFLVVYDVYASCIFLERFTSQCPGAAFLVSIT
jgi:hypothetical protein